MHTMTGFDTTSSVFVKGQLNAYKILSTSEELCKKRGGGFMKKGPKIVLNKYVIDFFGQKNEPKYIFNVSGSCRKKFH